MLVGINGHGGVDLFEIVEASGDFGLFFTITESGQEQSREDGNNRDYDKQLNERESASASTGLETRSAYFSRFHIGYVARDC